MALTTEARFQPFAAENWQRRALGGVVLLAIVVWWAARTFGVPKADFELAYQAGQAAWANGHPESLASWDGTPFLAAATAIASRVLSRTAATDLWNVVNIAVVVAMVGLALYKLRGLLSPAWWWLAAFALVSFAPMMSSVWFKQFNVVSLGLALAGFQLVRRRSVHRAGALLGLSVALKPLAFLLPVVLLARRETRRAGAEALAWAAGLNLAAQALIAVRAHDFAVLSPWIPLQNFISKSKPTVSYACDPWNFAPGSLLCRLEGPKHWTLQHLVVWAAVALLGAWVIEALRGRDALSWELFAFTLAISVMLSPLAWSHYQIMLAPLFVLLLVRFTREGASPGLWAGLVVAFVLDSLVWDPEGTLIGSARYLLSGTPQTHGDLVAMSNVGQFGQYVLVITGVLWYTAARQRGHPPTRESDGERASGLAVH